MGYDPNLLNEKERILTNYLEKYTTDEVLTEVQKYIPFLRSYSHILRNLRKMRIPHSVINTLIYYVLATNNQQPSQLLKLAALCRKFNIKNAHAAIAFLKKYYIFQKG
jgi:replication initiation and membrane attachment protein DnaB